MSLVVGKDVRLFGKRRPRLGGKVLRIVGKMTSQSSNKK